MSDYNPLEAVRFGVITPLILPADGPPVGDRIKALNGNQAVPEERVRGWAGTREIDPIGNALETAWVQYNVIRSSVTDDSMEEEDVFPLGDLPCENSDARLLLVKAVDSELQLVLDEYLECIDFQPETVNRVVIDSDVLKTVFHQEGLIEVVRGVKSKSGQIGYEGDARLHASPDFDVRSDAKFQDIRQEEWTQLKFVPKPEGTGFEGMPPVIELRAPGTLRLWVGWSTPQVLEFIREICELILDLHGKGPDEDLLAAAAKPPYEQSDLGEFF